jgi:DNA-binding NarL/FixJ family response regulator
MIERGSDAKNRDRSTVKILIADDSAVVRRGIRQVLSAQTGMAIVGEAVSYAQTIQMACDLEPHVVVLDLHMPDETSFPPQDVKTFLNRGSEILAISVWDDEYSRELAECIGAAVFLATMNLANTLIPTIEHLNRGRVASVSKASLRLIPKVSCD